MYGSSRNSPNFAVALNCGIGSSSLNADVNAFERLQMVRGRNSSYFGSKPEGGKSVNGAVARYIHPGSLKLAIRVCQPAALDTWPAAV